MSGHMKRKNYKMKDIYLSFSLLMNIRMFLHSHDNGLGGCMKKSMRQWPNVGKPIS